MWWAITPQDSSKVVIREIRIDPRSENHLVDPPILKMLFCLCSKRASGARHSSLVVGRQGADAGQVLEGHCWKKWENQGSLSSPFLWLTILPYLLSTIDVCICWLQLVYEFIQFLECGIFRIIELSLKSQEFMFWQGVCLTFVNL